MSITPAQTLSLLRDILREQPAAAATKETDTNGFAERLDRALERGQIPESVAPEALQRAAEALRLETLRSSLGLLDEHTEPAAGLFPALPPTSATFNIPAGVQAYLANRTPENATTTDKAPSVAAPVEPGPKALSKLSLLRDNTPADGVDSIIAKASRHYGVEPALIRAVIKAESNFNPRAVSHAGAQGLMQLMPATARGLGVSDPFNPEQNVMGGTRFLKSLLDRYNGNLDSALAAYNWGPGNVDRRPDRLPRETRDYLVKVKQYYNGYLA